MTVLLEKAVAEVKKLSASDQDAIAAIVLDEIADEAKWDVAFAQSQDQLARLAAKARADIQAGRVKSVGMDEL